MRKAKEILRLTFELGLGQRQIARSCGMGLGTVHNHLERAATVVHNCVASLQDYPVLWKSSILSLVLLEERGHNWRSITASLWHSSKSVRKVYEGFAVVAVFADFAQCRINKLSRINAGLEFKSTPRNQPFHWVTSVGCFARRGRKGQLIKLASFCPE